MDIPNKYVDKTVLKACAALETSIDDIGRINWLGEESDEDFDIDDLVNRLTEMLAPWAARMVDEEVCDDHLALARLVVETMLVQFHIDRGELLPE
jgi:hypothetical protein